MTDRLIFRIAAPDDLPAIGRLERDVFHGEQGIALSEIPIAADPSPLWWCAEEGGSLIAAAAAWKEDGATHWGRFAVLPGCRGRGVGTRLARFSFGQLFGSGVGEIVMEARDATVSIVLKMGGEITGDPQLFFGSRVTPVVLRRSLYRPDSRREC